MLSGSKYTAIHQDALEEFDDIYSAGIDERRQALEDRRFYSISGAQWDGWYENQFQNKVMLESNKVHLAVIRIINEYRNNNIDVVFSSPDGGMADASADTLTSLLRADEKDSCAGEAYNNAFEEAVGGGMGAWRIRPVYEDEETDDDDYQRPYFEPIVDADQCVYFDLGTKRQDKSDAKCCFVMTGMPPRDFEDEYGHPGSDFSYAPNGNTTQVFEWYQPDMVYIAEYYKVEEYKETVYTFTNDFDDVVKVRQPEIEEQRPLMLATGYKETSKKKVAKKRVHKYILSGSGVEEDCGYLPGKYIPIIVTYGKRWYINGVERFMGHVRLSKDMQRLKNMQLSKCAEISALSPVEKPIFYPEEVAGLTDMWARDNQENFPYLLKNRMKDLNGNFFQPAQEFTRSPSVPPALQFLLQGVDTDLNDLLGNQQQGEKIAANTSDKAVELVQTRLDMQAFIYMANFGEARKWAGKVWLSMVKELYTDKGRKLRSINKEGKVSKVEIMRPMYEPKTGEIGAENDFSKLDFDVNVDVKPSSSSQKAATVRALTGMMSLTQDPETLSVLTSAAMMNMEGEGLKDINEFFRQKGLALGFVKPNKEEQAELAQIQQQPEKPDPNAQYLEAASIEALAKADKARADAVLAQAKAQESRAKTAETVAGLDDRQQDRVLQYAQGLDESNALPVQTGTPPP